MAMEAITNMVSTTTIHDATCCYNSIFKAMDIGA